MRIFDYLELAGIALTNITKELFIQFCYGLSYLLLVLLIVVFASMQVRHENLAAKTATSKHNEFTSNAAADNDFAGMSVAAPFQNNPDTDSDLPISSEKDGRGIYIYRLKTK